MSDKADILPAEEKPRGSYSAKTKVEGIKMITSGMKSPAIRRALGVSRATVQRWKRELRTTFRQLPHVEAFREIKGDITDAALMEVLKTMVQRDKLSGSNLRDCSYAVKVLNDVSRLERGLSTANIAHSFTRVDIPK
jgi:transposase